MSEKKAVAIRCTAAANIPLEDLIGMQGALKTLSKENEAKLRKQILDTGFRAPIFVWKHGKQNKVLDGHQRLVVLKNMAKEGYTVPPLPVAYVEAENEKDAYKAILQFSSSYGTMTEKGLSEFLGLSGIETSSLSDDFTLPEIDITYFIDSSAPTFSPGTAEEQGRLDEKKQITCPECGHEFSA
jgi:hypothetical protein